jgi:hypothetical protein
MRGQLTNIKLADSDKLLVNPTFNRLPELEQAMGLFFPALCLKGQHFLRPLFVDLLSFSPHLILELAAFLGSPEACWEGLRIFADPVRSKVLL